MNGPAGLRSGERERLLRFIELHRGGRLAEAIAGYRAVLSSQPGLFDAHRLLGAALLAAGAYDEAVEALAKALAISPAMPEVWVHMGEALAHLGRREQSAASYERALALDPRRAAVWNALGSQWLVLGRLGDALACFDRTLALDPGLAAAWCNRGLAQFRQQRLEEALTSYEQAVQAAPRSQAAWRGKAATLTALGRLEEALQACNQALDCGPAGAADSAPPAPDRELVYCRGLLQLTLGDWAAGWEGFEARRAAGARLPDGVEAWRRGAPLAGRRILLAHEQGLGDTIQFCRFAPALNAAGATVLLQAPRSLHALLQTLQGVAGIFVDGAPVLPGDLACVLPSLPHRLGIESRDISPAPYLAADPAKHLDWQQRLGARGRPRVGLVVSGNPAHENDAARSIPLRAFEPLLRLDVEWHLLQRELAARDEADLRRLSVADHRGQLADFSDTAALAATMDLLVSVDTSVAHMAGAMGVPVFLLLPFVPDWRWMLEREDTPWYSSMRLFRQARRGDWDSVLARVKAEIARRFHP